MAQPFSLVIIARHADYLHIDCRWRTLRPECYASADILLCFNSGVCLCCCVFHKSQKEKV